MVSQIQPGELAQKLTDGKPVYLLDVRQPWEHETAALPNSVLIPLHELTARRAEIVPPKGTLVVVYCHHGIRSLSGAYLLKQMGFTQVASLAGGIDAWSREVDAGVVRY